VAAVTTNRDSHRQNRDQRGAKRQGLGYRRSAVRNRYVQARTVPADGNWLRGADNKGPDSGNNLAVSGRIVSSVILLARCGTPSAFVTNVNAGSTRPEPVVSARPCRIRQGLYSFLKRSSSVSLAMFAAIRRASLGQARLIAWPIALFDAHRQSTA
jgi:hypothetical protein